MAKRIKTVTGGRLSAVVCYTIPTVRDGPEERASRGRMSKEAQELINMRRSWQKLEMMLAANFCARDLHVVLTYGDQHLPPDRDAANKLLRKMLSQLRKYRKARGAGRPHPGPGEERVRALAKEGKVKGMNEYNASNEAQEALAAEKALVDGIRADTAMNEDYWDAGYERGQWYSKGVAAGIADGMKRAANATAIQSSWEAFGGGGNNSYFDIDPGSFAVGLNRVPYDNFPALLHEGERVLTASQARAEERGGPTVQVTVTGNSFYGSDAAMEDRVAQKLAREVARAVQLGV